MEHLKEIVQGPLSLIFTQPNHLKLHVIDTASLEKHNNIQNKHFVVPPNYQIDTDQQYTDDISKIWTSVSAIKKMKDDQPVKLA